MKRRILSGLVAIAVLLTAGTTAVAEGKMTTWRYDKRSVEPPFPRSERAAAVWSSDRCWRECGSFCAWGMAGCLRQDSQGHCLKLTDRCDRYCQRECRVTSGPYLPIELPWD